MKKTLLFVISALFLNSTFIVGKVRYVKENATGDGSSWANASGNLNEILSNSVSGDQIWVAKGTYTAPSGDGFILKNNVDVYGCFEGYEEIMYIIPDTLNKTILKSNGDGRVLTQDEYFSPSNNINWIGLTFTGGNADFAQTSRATGGGVFITGGGIKPISLQYCSIVNNIAGEKGIAGGIYMLDGYLLNSVIGYNIASSTEKGEAGGVLAAAAKVINCQIIDNVASVNGIGYGGGCSGNGSFLNCIITGNVASENGEGYGGGVHGGVYINCNLISNTASVNGVGYGGVSYLDDNNVDISVSFRNSIMWNNYKTPTQSEDVYIKFSNNKSVKNCILQEASSFSGNNNINNDPLFVDLSNSDYTLQNNSPAINSGNNIFYNTSLYNGYADFDFLGSSRFVGTIDIGANEKQSTVGIKDNNAVSTSIQYLGSSISNPDHELITIFNSVGVVVFVSDANSINVQHLSSGLYIAKSKTATIKFIK